MANVQKRGNSFLIRVSTGYDTTGKQLFKTMTWKPPEGMTPNKAQKEARHQAALFEEKVRLGQVADERIKFQGFADRWFLDYAETHLRPTTISRYKDMMSRIIPAFGHLYMDKIRPVHLMEFYKNLSTEKISTKVHCSQDLKAYLRNQRITKTECAERAQVSLAVLSSIYQGRNIERRSAEKICRALDVSFDDMFEAVHEERVLSAKTIQHYHRLLSSIFHSAVKWQVIVSNPCDRVDPPKPGKAPILYLDDREAVHMLELLEDAPIPYKCAVTVLLFTGMRRGELLGLKWPDIDFSKHTISIQRSSLYLAEKGIFEDDTKNDSSNRVIKIPEAAVRALRTMRAWQAQQRLLLQDRWIESGKVFTTLYGAPMHPDSLSGWFRDFIQKTDLPPIHLHSLRHTNASLNLANGIAITTVSGQLGHADASTTAKIYAHVIKSAQAASADMMDDLLGQRKSM